MKIEKLGENLRFAIINGRCKFFTGTLALSVQEKKWETGTTSEPNNKRTEALSFFTRSRRGLAGVDSAYHN